MSLSDYMTYDQLSEFLQMPKGTLYALVHQKRIPHIRIGPRTVRFSKQAIEKWMEKKCQETQ